MWQVFLRVRSYDETWDVPQEGEVFDTEAAADARADELDAQVVWPDFYVAKRVD
jgi:hypothetical protein